MTNLDQQILESLKANPGQKAREMATKLNVDRKQINSALFGRLKGKVTQDSGYRWYIKGHSKAQTDQAQEAKRLDTPLSRLCTYYLDCLSHDDLGGVSEFAYSKYGDPDYAEISELPMVSETEIDPFDSDEVRKFLQRIRRDKNRKTIYLGYPTRLKWVRSRKGWEGYFVEPILLLPFQESEGSHGTPTPSDELPQINFKALQSLINSGNSGLMEEAIQLADELGLGNTGSEQPDFDEVLARLYEIRPEWDWIEPPNPYSLKNETPIARLSQQGIHNKAILVGVERSPYTKGLETELAQLQKVDTDTYANTALGDWINRENLESSSAAPVPLLEALPLNSEQRQAVRRALANKLTVITGPPGTGKSQVVTSILINAAWQNKTVLFASKNNKAVDVVETRVNALGPRPILLRLGANKYQSKLAEYLVNLLAATATSDDSEKYTEYETIHSKLQEQSNQLDAEIQNLIDLRNEVDQLEQNVESIRQDLGEEVFQQIKRVDSEELREAAIRIQNAIDWANLDKQPIFTRFFWLFIRKERYNQLSQEAEFFRSLAEQIGLPIPELQPDVLSIERWIQYREQLDERLSCVFKVQEYFSRLEDLTQARSLEELSKQRLALTDNIAKNSEHLWKTWLRLQPARLSSEQRKLLGDYSSLLQMIVSANNNNRTIGGDAFRKYYQLFPKITSILSCWAVTSLSARGRIPIEPNFFDLLVIDEASQCDIASALPLLFRARRVVVIGDQRQLRHISILSTQQDQQLLSKHNLMENYAGWAYSTNSLFNLASSMCQGDDIIFLRDHHRSHADIIEFSNNYFYENRLRVATQYERLCRPWNTDPAVRWINVQGKTIRPGSGSAINEDEAKAVVNEVERLVTQGYKGTIGVVSPFRAQANRIREMVHQRQDLALHLNAAEFLSEAVHSFQGDERDVMIFSPVITNDPPRGALWFLQNYPNLFNVAITRARAALIVVGDQAGILNCNVKHLSKFADYTNKISHQKAEESLPKDTDLGPTYPKVSNPERVSEWEHIFYRALYQAGIRSIPQYPVEKYVLDFAVIDGDRRLNIEIDGEHYHRNWDGELCRRDQIRNQRLMELGWDVMRFWVYQVRDDLDRCVERVKKWLMIE